MKHVFLFAFICGIFPFSVSAENLTLSIQQDAIGLIGKSNLAIGELKRKTEQKTCIGRFYTLPKVEVAHMETLVEVIEDLEAIKHKNLSKYKLKLSLLVSQAKIEVNHGTKRSLCKEEDAPKIDAYESALKTFLVKLEK